MYPFQSSPAPKSGCNLIALGEWIKGVAVSILTRSEERVQPKPVDCIIGIKKFQSSPAPKSGCNGSRTYQPPNSEKVSILTRSEERVQHRWDRAGSTGQGVSILTRSEERVQPGRWAYRST